MQPFAHGQNPGEKHRDAEQSSTPLKNIKRGKKMFAKVKDVMNSGEGIEKINKQIAEQKKEMGELRKEVEEMRKEINESLKTIKEFVKLQKEIKENNEECNNQLEKSSKELQHTVDDFKVMKSRLQNKVFEEVGKEFKIRINEEIEKIRKDMNDFALAKENVQRVLGEVTKLNVKIEEFNSVAQKIKREDFELTKFANRIFAEDKNKLELMKRIDTLEKVIAKQRRSGNNRY